MSVVPGSHPKQVIHIIGCTQTRRGGDYNGKDLDRPSSGPRQGKRPCNWPGVRCSKKVIRYSFLVFAADGTMVAPASLWQEQLGKFRSFCDELAVVQSILSFGGNSNAQLL